MSTVFVGNIPYDATEEQLIDLCKEVGPVVSFRLVFDKDTGKPKGFGYCEYPDKATAASAMRNLNGREFNGRTLRVDVTDPPSPAKRAREDEETAPKAKKARVAGKVLIFIDMGYRKASPFKPILFGEISEKKWNVLDIQLDDDGYEVSIKEGDIDFDIDRKDIKLVVVEADEPERYKTVRDFMVNELKQELEDIHFMFK